MAWGPKQRRQYRARKRAEGDRALKARAERPSPMAIQGLSFMGSRGTEVPVLRVLSGNVSGRLTSDALKSGTHKGFSNGRMGHKEARKPERFKAFEYGERTAAEHVVISKADPVSSTLVVNNGDRTVEKRTITMQPRHSVDPDVVKRWENRDRVKTQG